MATALWSDEGEAIRHQDLDRLRAADGLRAGDRGFAERLNALHERVAVAEVLPSRAALRAAGASALDGRPTARGLFGLAGMPGPTRARVVVDDQRLGRQSPGVAEHGVGVAHLVQAELEEHDIRRVF